MKKGFTLIELLAVIVILAIIALIATPIVLNIINDTKESASLRSAEMYLNAVEQSIAKEMLQNKYIVTGTYNITIDGNICLKYKENSTECADILFVEVEGEKPSIGNITIIDGNVDTVSIEFGDKTLGKNSNGGFSPVCKLSKDSRKKGTQLGAKYECEVRPGEKQSFYVLSNNDDGTTNLIMDGNICEDGTLATAEKTCLVAWNESGNNIDGTITVMDYLSTATSDWTNLKKMTINSFEYGDSSHDMETYNVHARLPRYSEVTNYDGTNGYLYNNLGVSCKDNAGVQVTCENATKKEGVFEEGLSHIDGINGYWFLSSDGISGNMKAYCIEFESKKSKPIDTSSSIGVRPVITVKL